MTEWELPKTDADYEKSYTLKMFIFQAVNFWSSIFYIAFVKGRGTGTPLHYTRFGGSGSIRLEECHPSGCLFDLTMQLAIIMILKQAIGNVMELGVPFFKGYLRKKKESGFEGKPWKRDICLEQEPIYKPIRDESSAMTVTLLVDPHGKNGRRNCEPIKILQSNACTQSGHYKISYVKCNHLLA